MTPIGILAMGICAVLLVCSLLLIAVEIAKLRRILQEDITHLNQRIKVHSDTIRELKTRVA